MKSNSFLMEETKNKDPTIFEEGSLGKSLLDRFKPKNNGPAINNSGIPAGGTVHTGIIQEPSAPHVKTQEEKLADQALCEQYFNEAQQAITDFKLKYPIFPTERVSIFKYESVSKAKKVQSSTVKLHMDTLKSQLGLLSIEAEAMMKSHKAEIESKSESAVEKKISQEKNQEDVGIMKEISLANTQVGKQTIAVEGDDFDDDSDDDFDDEDGGGIDVDAALADELFELEHDLFGIIVYFSSKYGTPMPRVMNKVESLKFLLTDGYRDILKNNPDDEVVKILRSPMSKLALAHLRILITMVSDIYEAKNVKLTVTVTTSQPTN